jgi:hypothetical protein
MNVPESTVRISPSNVRLGAEPIGFAVGEATGLNISDKLTNLMAFLPTYYDSDGYRISRPVPLPDESWPTFRYAPGQRATEIADQTTQLRSVSRIPNIYIVRSTTPSGEPLAVRYQVASTELNSVERTKIKIVETIEADGAASTAQLLEIAKARAKQDRAVVRTITFSTPPDPRHDGWDVVSWRGERMLEVAWNMDLDAMVMQHTIKKVYADA